MFILYCIILYYISYIYIVLYYIILFIFILYYLILFIFILYYIILFIFILYYIILFIFIFILYYTSYVYIILYYIILYYIILYYISYVYIILYFIILFIFILYYIILLMFTLYYIILYFLEGTNFVSTLIHKFTKKLRIIALGIFLFVNNVFLFLLQSPELKYQSTPMHLCMLWIISDDFELFETSKQVNFLQPCWIIKMIFSLWRQAYCRIFCKYGR